MLAVYTFGSAEDMTAFCARQDIAGSDTYSVLQSLVAPIWEGECYPELRLTLVVNMTPEDLQRIKAREGEHEAQQKEAERKRQRAIDAENARWAEEQKRVHAQRTAASDDAYPDGIPF